MLFVGDDWAEDHHDVEVQDQHGRSMRTARLAEGVDGMTRFHELVARFLPDDADPSQVLVCIETDRGPWVQALVKLRNDGDLRRNLSFLRLRARIIDGIDVATTIIAGREPVSPRNWVDGTAYEIRR
jgi:hypothetical protein